MRTLLVALLLTTAWSGANGQARGRVGATIALELRGLDGPTRLLTTAELARMARHDTAVSAHHVSGRFSGVPVSALLALVHAPAGDSLRGAALMTAVVVQGADGYRALFSLADFDAGYTNRNAILADMKDGKPLPAGEGPLQLIVPGEQRPARWVRQVVRIELRRIE